MQTFTAPLNTTYKIQCWGASGGGWNNYQGYHDLGGKGGYSIGYKSLITSNKLYICVGSQGSSNSENAGGNGGYNGGGKGGNGYSTYLGAGGGGGATHIAITSNRGELKNYKDYYQSELLLVAGGGGGSVFWKSGGFGGGLNGGNAYNASDVYTITGASQNTGYAFGQGQDGKSKTVMGGSGAEGNGGGGGGFYGGPASQQEGENSNCSGAGGSGYIGGITNGATIAGDQTFPSPNGGTEQGHRDHGYAIITWQQLP